MKRVAEPVRSRAGAHRACALAIAAAFAAPAGAVETAILLSPAPSTTAEMAYAVGVEGTWVVIGAPGEDAVAGAIYAIDCSTSPCANPIRIVPADVLPDHAFGTAISISGDTFAATAPGAEPGAAYIYVHDDAIHK